MTLEPSLPGGSVWVVLPTYNEAENLPVIARAILQSLPAATLLVVDDGSPDGTGQLADELAAGDSRVRVRHRAAKQGLGRAYLDGFGVALAGGASVVVQMDADQSHDPAVLPALVGPVLEDRADLVIGSRYVAGGQVGSWGLARRVISRGGSIYTAVFLHLGVKDPTAGFKCFRRAVLEAIEPETITARGYAFQIEMTFRVKRHGFRIVEVPINFDDRTHGASKMSRWIVLETVWRVPLLRLRG